LAEQVWVDLVVLFLQFFFLVCLVAPSGCVVAVGDSNALVATSCDGGQSFVGVAASLPSGMTPSAGAAGGTPIGFNSILGLFVCSTTGASEAVAVSSDASNWTQASGTTGLTYDLVFFSIYLKCFFFKALLLLLLLLGATR
jgi:hypothetical protein